MASKNPRNELVSLDVEIEEEALEDEEGEDLINAACSKKPRITRELRLKMPENTSEKVDRDAILRRIRHRRRMNNVKNVVGALFSSPFTSTDKVSVEMPTKWVDNAFAAP